MKHTYDVALATTSLGGWEEVSTADQGTRYARFGAETGAPIIILLAATGAANIWPELFDSLSEDRPVYLPDLPDADYAFGPRMRAFLDRLDLTGATLIAPGGFCLPAVELARREPQRFGGLVLVPTNGDDERALNEIISITRLEEYARLLVVPRTTPLGEAMRRVSEFVKP